MNITRRQLIKSIPAGFAGLMLPGLVHAASAAAQGPARKLVIGSGNNFCLIDIDTQKLLLNIDVGFMPHSFVKHALKPSRIWTMQRDPHYKGGLATDPTKAQAAEVDIVTGQITRTIIPAPGSEFRGHAVMAPGSNVIFITRVDNTKGLSYLTGYDTDSGEIVADHFVVDASIHDSQIAADGSVFVASTGFQKILQPDGKIITKRTGKGGIVHFDLQKDKQVSMMTIEDNDQYLGHFCILKNGKVFAGSNASDKKTNPGIVYGGQLGRTELTPVEWVDLEREKKQSEMFGFAVNEHDGTVAVSNYRENAIFRLDATTGKITGKTAFNQPFGIVYDGARGEFIAGGETLGIFNRDFAIAESIRLKTAKEAMHFFSGHAMLV